MKKTLLVILIVVVVGALAGYLYFTSYTPTSPRLALENGGITLSDPPALGQTATLTFTIVPTQLYGSESEPAVVRIVLENGLEWVDDNSILEDWEQVENTHWLDNDSPKIEGYTRGVNVDAFENVPVQVEGTIRAVKIGTWNIEAFLVYKGRTAAYSGYISIHVQVSENSAQVGEGYHWPWMDNENVQHGQPVNLAPRLPLNIELSFTQQPSLNQAVDLTCSVRSEFDVADASVEIDLPSGFIVIDGDLNWEGEILGGTQVEFNVKVKMVELGDWEIQAQVSSQALDFSNWGWLFVFASEDNVTVSDTPVIPENMLGVKLDESQLPSEYRLDTEERLNSLSTENVNSITIAGRFIYYDEYGHEQPRRWVTVEVFDVEDWPLEGKHLERLGETSTDSDGWFEFTTSHKDDGWGDNGNGLDIELHVRAQNDGIVWVRPMGTPPDYSGGIYTETTGEFPDLTDGETHYLGTFDPAKNRWYEGAWRVFDTIIDGWEYLDDTIQYQMPKVSVDWPAFNSQYVVIWDVQVMYNFIEIALGHDMYPDQILHEYGHYVMHEACDWWFPSYSLSDHNIGDVVSESEAWVEGWASFFALAVDSDGRLTQFPIENQTEQQGWAGGSAVEGRVASALYDLLDSDDDGLDQISLGFEPIWDVFKGDGYRSSTFSEFWDAFKTTYSDDERVHFAKMALFQNTIDYNNNPTCSIAPIADQVLSPVLLSAQADDADWEDISYLQVEFEYSLNNDNWHPISSDSEAPYSVLWYVENLYPNVWVRALAHDGMEDSGWSVTGPFVISGRWTSLTLDVTDNELYLDENLRFVGRLTYGTERGIENRAITLYIDNTPTGDNATTDKNGYYTVQIPVPPTLGQYVYHTNFTGDNLHSENQSPDVTITVTRRPITLGLDVTENGPYAGQLLEFFGRLVDDAGEGLDNRTVTLYQLSPIQPTIEENSTLEGWSYRAPITLLERSGNDLENYQVPVTLDTPTLIEESKLQENLSDLRFSWLDNAGVEHEIPYWIERSLGTRSDKIWVRVPWLPANSTTTIYAHYGNQNAASAENGDATFVFFDNFDVIDDEKWNQTSGWAVSDGVISAYGSNKNLVSVQSWPFSGKAVHARVRTDQPGPRPQVRFLISASNGTTPYDVPNVTTINSADGVSTVALYNGYVSSLVTYSAPWDTNWHDLAHKRADENVVGTYDDEDLTISWGIPKNIYVAFRINGGPDAVTLYIDHVFMRNYVEREPAIVREVGSATTDENGDYAIQISAPSTPGEYVYLANFGGDQLYWGSSSPEVRINVTGPAPLLPGENVSGSVLYGQTKTVPVEVPAGTKLFKSTADWQGSDLDLHVYDPQGRHVGYNYKTDEVEIEIPGAKYSGRTAKPEWVEVLDPEPGIWWVEVYAYEVEVSETYTISFLTDTTPPVTEHELSGTQGDAGWWVSDVGVELSATDDLSGVDETLYRIDGGAWQSYAGSFVVSGDGTHSVDYYSTDVAGNEEAMESIEIKIDTLPPITSHELSGVEGNAGWWVSDVTVTLSAADDTNLTTEVSGVDLTKYRINGGEWTVYSAPFVIHEDGVHVVDFYSVDVTGNEEETNSIEIKVDQTPPEITTLAVAPEVLWPPNHELVEVSITVAAEDTVDPSPTIELVGVESNEPDDGRGDGHTTDDIQGAEIGTLDTSVLLRAERGGGGTGRIYTITYRATDEAGNSSEQSVSVTVPHDMGNN